MDTINLRKKIESLVRITEDSWKKINTSFKLKNFKKGDLFVSEGYVCKYVAFNIDGIFREYYYHDGIDKTSDFIFKNSFFSAYTSFIRQTPSDVCIEALTNAQALVMDYTTKQELFDSVFEWDRLARRITEEHYSAKEKRVHILSGLTARDKYMDLLTNGNPEIIKNIPLQYIASYLGITPETLSRIRNKM